MRAERLAGGADFAVPVRFTARKPGSEAVEAIDLSGGTVTVEVFSYHNRLFEAEFRLEKVNPGEGDAHGVVLLSEEQTEALPYGASSYLKATFYRPADDLTVIAEPFPLDRVL